MSVERSSSSSRARHADSWGVSNSRKVSSYLIGL